MKYTKVLGLALATLAFGACSDEWDEHYDVKPVGTGESLWQTISADAELSNFARVLEACEFDLTLKSPQVFTVFAPTNADLTDDQVNSLIETYQAEKKDGIKDEDNRTIKEFVKNHIALYNHSVSSSTNDTLVMMNGKYLPFTPNSLGGKAFKTKNVHLSNGILFTMDEQLDYFSNVFEALGKIEGLDSIAAFFYEYNEYKFMPEKSVPGGIVDGQTVYLDSVTELRNELFSMLGKIADEDSSYVMVAPDNEDWNRMVEEYKEYFNYSQDIFAEPVVDELALKKRDSLHHLMTRMAIVRGTVFSRTLNPNMEDSARSTNAVYHANRKYAYGDPNLHYYFYKKPYEVGGPFYGAVKTECSNGEVLKAYPWNLDKSQTFFQQIFVEAESRSYLAGVDDIEVTSENPKTNVETYTVTEGHPLFNKISSNSFVTITPTGAGAMPSVSYYLPDVLSNIPYDLYMVTLPATAVDTAAVESQKLPSILKVNLIYKDEKGVKQDETLQAKIETAGGDKIDTLLLKENLVLPTCSYGLSTPQVIVEMTSRVTNSQVNKKTHTRTLRVDCLILKPREEGDTSNN